MIIAGLQKVSLIDYPGKIACVVFLAVCNFRCPWCYSSELVLPEKIAKGPRIPESIFFEFLRKRKELLEGVVICGGEPTIHKELPSFIEKIKRMDYAVKLDTNGSNPQMLKDLIMQKLVDYVAMDIKFPIDDKKNIYQMIIKENVRIDDIKRSVEILKNSGIDFEFRTTVVPTIHQKEDFLKIAKWIGGPNVKYYLQNFFPSKTVNPEFEKIAPFQREFLEEIAKEISPFFKICQVRG